MNNILREKNYWVKSWCIVGVECKYTENELFYSLFKKTKRGICYIIRNDRITMHIDCDIFYKHFTTRDKQIEKILA